MLRIPFEWLEFGLERFESLSNGLNLHSNASNLFRIVRIWIRMLQITYEWFEFEFRISNSANHFRTVRICFRILQMFFEWLEFAFECFESLSNI